MKIIEHVNQGLEDAFQKKISPWLLPEPYLGWKKIVSRVNGVLNIQGEAKKNPK